MKGHQKIPNGQKNEINPILEPIEDDKRNVDETSEGIVVTKVIIQRT